MAQAGFFGVQIVAPRSIIACAKSPARRGGNSSRASREISGLAAGSGVVTAKSRAITRSILPSTGLAGAVESDGRDRGGGIGADAGERAQRGLACREHAAVALDHGAGAGVQVAGAGVIAQPGPGLQDVAERRRRQRLEIGPARQEARIIGRDGLDRGLLQHDLGEPDPVRIGALAGRRPPRQFPAVAVVPGEEGGGLR